MIVEVIAVGTELLIGQIINTNGATIGAKLAEEGFDAHYQVTVGDNLGRLADAIRTALGRADAVILTGGIGPTQDDLTREAICEVTGRSMARDEEHAERIRKRILAMRGTVADNVVRMADYPEGADPLPNAEGVALGIALQHEGKLIFAVPGVPREMNAIVDTEVLPRLRAAAGGPTVIKSRVLHTWGYGESQVAEALDDLYESTNPSIAFLISDMEVRVRITAKASSVAEADDIIAPVEKEIRDRIGSIIFAEDGETNLDILTRELDARTWTIATTEVSSAGEVSSRIAAHTPGALAGGITLGAAAADAMTLAERARTSFSAAVGVGVAGAAVEETGGRASTVVDIAVVTPEGARTRAIHVLGSGARARAFVTIAALHLARLAVTGAWWDGD